MASYIKFNCDYLMVYLAQIIITLNGFDNILQHFYYFYNFSLKLKLFQVCIAYFYFFKTKSLEDLINP